MFSWLRAGLELLHVFDDHALMKEPLVAAGNELHLLATAHEAQLQALPEQRPNPTESSRKPLSLGIQCGDGPPHIGHVDAKDKWKAPQKARLSRLMTEDVST